MFVSKFTFPQEFIWCNSNRYSSYLPYLEASLYVCKQIYLPHKSLFGVTVSYNRYISYLPYLEATFSCLYKATVATIAESWLQ